MCFVWVAAYPPPYVSRARRASTDAAGWAGVGVAVGMWVAVGVWVA